MRDYITVGKTSRELQDSIKQCLINVQLTKERYEEFGKIRERLRILSILSSYLPTDETQESEEKLKLVMELMQVIQEG